MFCCKFTIYDVCVCRCKYKLRLQKLGPLDVPNVVSCWTPKKKLNGKKKKTEWERQMQLHEVVGKKGKEKETKTTTNSESNRIGI